MFGPVHSPIQGRLPEILSKDYTLPEATETWPWEVSQHKQQPFSCAVNRLVICATVFSTFAEYKPVRLTRRIATPEPRKCNLDLPYMLVLESCSLELRSCNRNGFDARTTMFGMWYKASVHHCAKGCYHCSYKSGDTEPSSF